MNEIIEKEIEVKKLVKQEAPVVEIKGLYKAFDHVGVLKGVNLNVRKGENVDRKSVV